MLNMLSLQAFVELGMCCTFSETEMVRVRKSIQERLRQLLLIIVTTLIFGVIFKFPTVHHLPLPHINSTPLSEFHSFIDDNTRKMDQYGQSTILRMDNFIFLSISTMLVILFSIINTLEVHNRNTGNQRSGMLALFLN